MVTRAQLIAAAAPALHEGEQVIDLTIGMALVRRLGFKVRRQATVLVTDRRVVIFSQMDTGYDVQDYAYGLLTGVDYKSGFNGGYLYLRASGDSAHVRYIEKGDIERIVQAIRQRMAAAHPAGAVTTAPVPTSDFAEEIRKLASLRDDGLLNEEEFQARRSKLLES
jgi:hypothetical protein